MEHFEQHTDDAAVLNGIAIDDSAEFADAFHRTDETDSSDDNVPEVNSTDDPVRVYLREMGSVRLLNRQGEIVLARRMERGKARMHKAISRYPLMWQYLRDLYEEVRKGKANLENFVDVPQDGRA